MSIDEEQPALVFDNGSALFKAGFAGDDEPKSLFPTAIVPSKSNSKIGFDAIHNNNSSICYPIQKRKIVNMDLMQQLWSHVIHTDLQVSNVKDRRILMTEHVLHETAVREEIAELVFEKFGFDGFYIVSQAILALYASGRIMGLSFIVDVGDSLTDVVPIDDGQPVRSAVKTMDVGGAEITSYLEQLLAEKGIFFASSSEARAITTDMKEQTSYAAFNYEREMERPEESVSQQYELPDGNTLSIGAERFKCVEALFHPSLIGKGQLGLHQITQEAVNALGYEMIPSMYNKIVLTGGGSKIPELSDRYQKELMDLFPSGSQVRVIAPPERHVSTWIGGSIVASLSTFPQNCVSRAEYQEAGPSIISKKCVL